MQQKIKTSLGIMIIIILAVTAGLYVWQIEKGQPDPSQLVSVSQQIPTKQTETKNDALGKMNEDELKNAVVSAVDNELKVRYGKTKDPGYASWDRKVDIIAVDPSQRAVKGEWWAKDAWDWIAWKQDDGQWKVLLSFDGFNCQELKAIPSQYASFFKDVTFQFGKTYCY